LSRFNQVEARAGRQMTRSFSTSILASLSRR
jgi:hypothetical protein